MRLIDSTDAKKGSYLPPEEITEEITERDERSFFEITSTELNPDQIQRIKTPPHVFPRESTVIAIHWHPEFVPMDLISDRINNTFPDLKTQLIIPTQHNVLMSYNGFHGVEVDCYSKAFNQKVQLLFHFESSKLEKADKFKSMLAYTFKYRSSQLFDFINTIIQPAEERLELAARNTGADNTLIHFVVLNVKKVHNMITKYQDQVPEVMIKNKLLRNFFDTLRPIYGNGFINRAQAFLNAVKLIVKSEFPLQYFYRTREMIEEVRSIGGAIVIPHPEQFWPILLADYDVDGIEVWNPQSRKYTEFLISVIDKKNIQNMRSDRRLLVLMGDDTHMGEKIKEPEIQDKAKAAREIGVQSAWEDFSIRKRLILANMSKLSILSEYKERIMS
ncbi:MAG: hypothetical protein GF315_13535 [candidate division Zixibacteria bacterium]|nr:hypothetical protein [candidate division Zixibacteria bacterium]